MKARTLAVLAVVAGLAAAGGVLYHVGSRGSGAGPGMDPAEVVERVLAAPHTDIKGETRRLADWRGRVLVVNYWATWCAPCREEIPVFVRMQERYDAAGCNLSASPSISGRTWPNLRGSFGSTTRCCWREWRRST